MAVKDRNRTRFNRLGIIALGYRVFRCKNGHTSHPNRWNGDASQECEICSKVFSGLSDRSRFITPYQPGHFVLTRAPDVMAFYAQKGIQETEVRRIEILFPFAERDRNFIANYQVWAGDSIVCEGDGELVQRAEPLRASQNDKGYWNVHKDSGDTLVSDGMACRAFDWNGTHFDEGDHVPCSGSGRTRLYPQCELCKLHSLVKVMMADPELFRVGYYRISTRSKNNYDAFRTMFRMMPENVQGIRFTLRMAKEKTKYMGKDGKKHSTEKWFLYLEPYPEDMLELYRRQAARQLGRGVVVEEPAQIPGQSGALDFNGDDGEYDEIAEPPADELQATPPPAESKPAPEKPAFENWQPGQWTTFCKAIADLMDCFESKAYVWALLVDMHGDPPEVNYEEAWTTCLAHYIAPGGQEPPPEELAF